jgi:hypothetical protein
VNSKQEDREKRIWKLLQEKSPYREICKKEHCSSNEVSRVNKKFTGKSDEVDIPIKNKSVGSHAFDCFLKKMSLPQIVRDLDIEPEKVNSLYKEFLLFENTHFNLNESRKYWQLKYKDLSKKYNDLLISYRRLQSSYR